MLKIAISAGELSGDEHATAVVQALQQLYPQVVVRGMGGRNLRALGVDTVVDSESTGSIMGFSAVLLGARKIFGAMASMHQLLEVWKPDCIILVDYADFNLRLARHAKNAGIKVLYLIPPQMWAWRSGRVASMRELVDCAAVIFPFERNFYESHGYKRSVFVGHPFVGELKSGPDEQIRAKLCATLDLDPQKPLVAILPGSRNQELKRHFTPMIEAFRKLRRLVPEVQGIIALPPTISAQDFQLDTELSQFTKITSGHTLEVMRSADVGVLKSGTSNLQAAFCGLPFVMFYKASRVSEFVARRFINLKEYSIVNVIRPGTVVELLQERAAPDETANELERLLSDHNHRELVRQRLLEVVDVLGSHDNLDIFQGAFSAAERVARLALSMCGVNLQESRHQLQA